MIATGYSMINRNGNPEIAEIIIEFRCDNCKAKEERRIKLSKPLSNQRAASILASRIAERELEASDWQYDDDFRLLCPDCHARAVASGVASYA